MNKNVLKTIKSVIFYILTFFLLAYVIVNLFIPKQSVNIFGFQVTTISRATESMKPTILPGDIIVLKRIKEKDVQEGDIISFYTHAIGQNRQGDIVWVEIKVVHRIIDIDDASGAYVTKGDNNASIDTIYNQQGQEIDLTFDQVIGEYAFRIPFVGTLVTGLRNPMMIGLLLLNGTIIVLLIKYVKKTKENPDDVGNTDSK